MKPLRCRLGFHRYRDLWRGPWDGASQDVLWKCLRCGKEERLRLFNPLSGPRHTEMHPEAGLPSGGRSPEEE